MKRHLAMRRLAAGLLLSLTCWSAPAAAVDVTAELGLVSDYRYRGISLSDGKPAAQASISVEHDSGAYVSIWSSTIEEPGFDADIEVDFAAGYALEVTDKLSLDLSATYYVYPSEAGSNYVEATAALERTIGPAALSLGYSFVPRQHGTRDEAGKKRANNYAFVGASYELLKLPLTLGAELGHERGFFDGVDEGGKWDWSLGANMKLEKLRLGLDFSGTPAGPDALVLSLFLEL